MPVKPETRFYRRVNNFVPPEIHRQKISSLYANGTADFWYSGFKADGWVEYKWIPTLSRNGVDPLKLLSSLQALWINRRYREGRYVFVVVGSPQGCAILLHGAWNNRVLVEDFRFTISEVSDFVTGAFYDVSEVLKQSSTGYKFDIQNSHDVLIDRGHRIRSLQTARAASEIESAP